MENNFIKYGKDALILAKLTGENWDIDSYIERGGYRALESILNDDFKLKILLMRSRFLVLEAEEVLAFQLA